jgi:hypothetical protein
VPAWSGMSGRRPPADGVGNLGLELGKPTHYLVVGQLGVAEQSLVVAEHIFATGVPQLFGEADH